MGHPDGAHTHGSGGSGIGAALAGLLIAVVAVAIAPAVIAIVHALLIAAAITLGIAAVGLVAIVAWRLRRLRAGKGRRASPLPPGVAHTAQELPEPRPAIERPAEVHLNLHGMIAADIAAIFDRHGNGPA